MASKEKSPVEEYFRGLKDRNGIEEALCRLWLETSSALSAVQQAAEEMHKRLKAERSEIRHQIVQRHRAEHGPDATIATSPLCIVVTVGVDSLEIGWSKVWRKKGTSDTNLTRVKMDSGSGHRPSTLNKEAHEDEHEVLWAHENEVRYLRNRWRDAMAIRSAVRSAMLKYLSEGTGRRVEN